MIEQRIDSPKPSGIQPVEGAAIQGVARDAVWQRLVLAAAFSTLVVSLTAAQISDAEKALADQLDCSQFKRNADGSWTGGPKARIGKIMAGAQTFVRGGFKIGGADIATVLDAKCGRQKP